MFSHQKQALAFMLNRENSVDPISSNSAVKTANLHLLQGRDEHINQVDPVHIKGGILADSMGLGKSLSTLALIAADLEQAAKNRTVTGPTLIVMPTSLIPTWEKEIQGHLHPGSVRYCIHHGSGRAKTSIGFLSFDIILTSYDIVSAEWRGLDSGPKPLFLFPWYRVILDEGWFSSPKLSSGNSPSS